MAPSIGAISTSRADSWVYRPLFKALPNIRVVRLGDHKIYGAEPWKTIVPGNLDQWFEWNTGRKGTDAHDNASCVIDSLREPIADLVFVIGDRSEMLAATLAAKLSGSRIVHIGGGATTLGSQDERWRNAITVLSDVHYVESEAHAQKVRALGAKNVHVVGQLALDNLEDYCPTSPLNLEDYVVVVYHPNTTSPLNTWGEFNEIVRATEGMNVVWTLPNKDRGNEIVVGNAPKSWTLFEGDAEEFWNLLSYARGIVGNSSAGILEAPYLGCPTINVGDRQLGRIQPAGIVNVPFSSEKIREAILNVEDPPNLEVDTLAAQQIVATLLWS